VGSAAVFGLLPEELEKYQVETAIIVLLVVCGVGMVVVLRTVAKTTTRLALLGLLFLVGVGLWWQREELEDCQGQCTCHVFGQDVRMPDEVNFNGVVCPD
jgi:ABC-type nickel/cobalt efflux system permease component RcnA